MKTLTRKQNRALQKIIIASILFAIGLAASFIGERFIGYAWIEIPLFVAAYIAVGLGVLIDAARKILTGQLLDESFLMAVATIGAFALGEFSEGVAVMLFYRVGELFESIAVSRSRRSITSLMELRADSADVLRGGEIHTVDPTEVVVGETIIVKPGEKLALDGVIIEGETVLNTSALTGESLPRAVAVGDEVLSGSVNGEGLIHIRVTKPFGESTVVKILDLVENSAAKKSRHEAFITRFARVYTPCVVALAILLATVPSFITGEWDKWVYQALNFLVISCPCALVISVPLSFFGGIGAASRSGILVKGGNYLEALASVDTVIFDKTGTLTEGVFRVSEIAAYTVSQAELLRLAAAAEAASSHPIARSIVAACKATDTSGVTNLREISGGGVTCKIDGADVAVGGERLMNTLGVTVGAHEASGAGVYVAKDGVLIGRITVSDTAKHTSREAVSTLRSLGVKRTVMLTGDNEAAASNIAKELSIDEYHAGLLPQEKVILTERLLEGGKCAFVGDGINDAPVLMRANVGIAMGGIGSDAAIEAADVVLMDDDPMKIAAAIKISRRTLRIARQNTVLALTVKGAIMLLGFLGFANMWLAVFADVGVSVLAILNAMRVQR